MHAQTEGFKECIIRIVLLGMSVIFSNCSISSNDTRWRTGIPASTADDVMSSVLRRMMAVNCDWSSSCWLLLVLGGVDMAWRSVSCARDLNRRVSLLLLDDPTCGVGSGRSLTCLWLADWSMSVPSGLVWCVFNLFSTWCCSSAVNASFVSIGRFRGGTFSYSTRYTIHTPYMHAHIHTYNANTYLIVMLVFQVLIWLWLENSIS